MVSFQFSGNPKRFVPNIPPLLVPEFLSTGKYTVSSIVCTRGWVLKCLVFVLSWYPVLAACCCLQNEAQSKAPISALSRWGGVERGHTHTRHATGGLASQSDCPMNGPTSSTRLRQTTASPLDVLSKKWHAGTRAPLQDGFCRTAAPPFFPLGRCFSG